MAITLPLDSDKKLTVIFRIEAGCLGPEGESLVEKFCVYAQKGVETIDADYINWVIEPRHDKASAEMEYKIKNKKLDHKKAEKYLRLFEKELDEFEMHLQDKLANLIDDFMGH